MRCRVTLRSGSPAAYAHAQLSRLDELIDRGQRLTMGHRTVLLMTLRREAEFFARVTVRPTRADNHAAVPRPA